MGLPNSVERAYIYLNEVCNLNCIFCASDFTNTSTCKTIYSLSQIETFIKKLANRSDAIVISGGEPTLSNQLFDILHYASNYFNNIQLMTNGLKLADKKYLFNLVNCGVSSICIPFVSPSPKVFEYLVGRNNIFRVFEKALHNVLTIDHKNRPIIQIKTIILKANIDAFKYFPKYIEGLPNLPDYFIINGLHIGSKVLENKGLIPNFLMAGKEVSKLIAKLSHLGLTVAVNEFPFCFLNNEAIEILVNTGFPISASNINTTIFGSNGEIYNESKHVKFEHCIQDCILEPFCDGYAKKNSELVMYQLENYTRPFIGKI